MALVLGVDPISYGVAGAAVARPGQTELGVAGGLIGQAVPVVAVIASGGEAGEVGLLLGQRLHEGLVAVGAAARGGPHGPPTGGGTAAGRRAAQDPQPGQQQRQDQGATGSAEDDLGFGHGDPCVGCPCPAFAAVLARDASGSGAGSPGAVSFSAARRSTSRSSQVTARRMPCSSISATAILPLAAGPLLGIVPVDLAGHGYGSSTIFLILGGCLLALPRHRPVVGWVVTVKVELPAASCTAQTT